MSAKETTKSIMRIIAFVAVISVAICCVDEQWMCTSGQCIDKDVVCDGIKNCTDGSDETLATCENLNCPNYAFRCSYGACIPMSAVCNSVLDCADGSDESLVKCKV